MLVSPGNDYSVSGQTILPSLNFAGVLTVPVRVNDGINNSASFDFKLQVNQVNDAPSFAAIPNQQVAENSSARSVPITGISKGPFEDHQQLTFVATSGNTAVMADPVVTYNGTGPAAVLSFVVKPSTSGVVTVNVVAIDNGANTPPHQNTYAASFQVEVLEINSAPTIDVINNITVQEDAEQQNITLAGISAGPGETQSLDVTVMSARADFFELLDVVYTSAEATGLLQFKTRPNVSGTVQLSVTVTDNGSGVSPNVNKTTRVFSVVVQPVNDPPVFTSQPEIVAVVNERYAYRVVASDADGDALAFSAALKPAWASLSASGNGVAILTGIPPSGATGNMDFSLQVKDALVSVSQNFSVYVNMRPVISALGLATEEDTPLGFPASLFISGYTDGNENDLRAVQVTSLPGSGILELAGARVKPGDTIPVASLSGLIYTPDENLYGADSFGWKAFDGYHFSLTAAAVQISVLPVNDPPQVIFLHDTLRYEVNGETALLSPLADIIDPDDDTLTRATISFHSRNYRPEFDLLEFQNTAGIRGNYNFQSGVLEFSGVAPLADYRTALRSIRYLHQNTLDPILEPKAASFVVHDHETAGPAKDKVIILQYTFIEFEIPSGFTPNGDNANDTWLIDRPGGGLDEMDHAIISIYNKQGVLVYRRRGFDEAWDGTMNGELLPADTYFFTIDLQLRNKKTYKGIVTLLR
jgi:gliding motility-associated-like protein